VRITAVLTPRGGSALVVTNARGQRAGKLGVGDTLRQVKRRATPFGRGLWMRPADNGNRFVYGIRNGRVAFAAVATRAAAGSPTTARRYLKLGGIR
jgi:hypothetical protein